MDAAPCVTAVPGPALPWKGRRHGRRQGRRWAKAWSPEQIAKRGSIEFVLQRALNEVAETDFARNARKATKYIAEQKQVSQSQLLRYLKVPARQLIEITQYLVETDVVVAQITKDGSRRGRPTTIFQLTQ
jgi:hypothetical protein